MTQSRKGSFLEAVLNTASGWVVAFIVWEYLVAPGLGLESNPTKGAAVTTVFSVVSIVRAYLWRRLFVYFQKLRGIGDNEGKGGTPNGQRVQGPDQD